MDEDFKKQVKKLAQDTPCEKNYVCLASDFEQLCDTEVTGDDNYLQCLDEDSSECNYSVPGKNYKYCSCPIRIYIKKHTNK